LVPEIETDDLAKAATYFLNIFSKCFIGSFTPAEFQFFLDETSHRTGVPLSQYKQQIEDLAGHFPFFVQIACYYYFDALVKNIKSLDHALARHRFMDEARSHFRYIWSHLDDHERDTVVALVEGKQLHQDKLWSLTRKGYVIDGALFSSAFAEFVKQEIGISHAKTGVSFDSDGNVRVVDDKRNKRVIPLERLARLERDLLRLLYEKKGKVCTYQEITDKVWAKHDPGYKGSAPPIDSIQQAVRRLRVKIEPDSDNPRFILTVGGEGYRLVDPQSHSVLLAAVGFLPTLLMLSKGMFKGVLAFGKGLLELARWTDEILAVTVVIVIVVIVVLVLIGKVNPAKIIELLKGLL
jgi:hypothetical protein